MIRLFHPDAQIDIFRHGKAVPQKDAAGGLEIQRHLTEEGRAQVRRLGAKIADIPYDLVISSPALRAMDTAFIAMSESRLTVMALFHVADDNELYMPMDQRHHDELLRLSLAIGHSRYGEYQDQSPALFGHFQSEMITALIKIPGIGNAKRIFVSNHGLIGSALAEVIYETITGKPVDGPSRDIVRNTAVPECGCLRVSQTGVEFIDYLA